MKKRRNKPYRPRPVAVPMIVGASLVFGPLLAVIDQIEREGTITVSRKGTAMFQDGDGNWYATAPALKGLIDQCEMWCVRHDKTLPLASVRELTRLVEYTMNIPESLMLRLRRDLPVLQGALARADAEDMLDILRQVEIKEALEARC